MTTKEFVLQKHKESPELLYSELARLASVSRQRVHAIIHNYDSIQRTHSRRFVAKLPKKCEIGKCPKNQRDIQIKFHHRNGNSRDNRIENIAGLCLFHHVEAHKEMRVNKSLLRVGRCRNCRRDFSMEVPPSRIDIGLCQKCYKGLKWHGSSYKPKGLNRDVPNCLQCGEVRRNKWGGYTKTLCFKCWGRKRYIANRNKIRRDFKERYRSDPDFRKKHLETNRNNRIKRNSIIDKEI